MVNPREPNRTWFPDRTSTLCKIGLHTTWHANVQLRKGLNIAQEEFPRSILIKMKTPKPKWNENIKTSVTPRDPHRAHTTATLLSNQIACGTIEPQMKQRNIQFTHQIYIAMSSQETPESKWFQESLIEHTSELHSSSSQTACGTFESWWLSPEPQIKQTSKSFKYHPSHISSGNSKIKMTTREPHRARATATLLFEPIAAASC